MTDLVDLTAHALAARIAAREVSCREVMQACLARIDAQNPRVNAIVSRRDPQALLAEADARDAALAADPHARRPFLFGLPQAIKDVSPVAGLPNTFGSPILARNVPAHDGLMAGRMKAAGCIVVGKTNTPEFGLGSHTFNEVFGATRNPYDPTRSAGGSSGGAAVALATRMLPVADGSDSMGSLRNPAAWNNVYGFRPSQGRVPFWPAHDVWVTHFGTEGPMARDVRDLALLLDVQAGYDPRVPLSLADEPSFADRLDDDAARPVRIGWLGDWGGQLAMEPGILDTCERMLRRLERDAGCAVEPLAPNRNRDRTWHAWLTWRHWLVHDRIGVHLDAKPENRALVKPEALWEYDQGAGLGAADTMAASVERTLFLQKMLALFAKVDILAMPSTQTWPFPVEWRWPKTIATATGERAMDTYHRWMEVVVPATFAGLPAISVPAGFSPEGWPCGLQLVGPPRADLAVLRLARRHQRAAADLLASRPPER